MSQSSIQEQVSALLAVRESKQTAALFSVLYAAASKDVREAVDAAIASKREGEVFASLTKRCNDDTPKETLLGFQNALENIAADMLQYVKSDTQSRGRNATEYVVHALTIPTESGTLKIVLTV